METCSSFPRLLYLSHSEKLTVVTHSANPVTLLPIISKLFPAVCDLSVTEVEMDMQEDYNSVVVQPSYQIVEVCDRLREPLRLCAPLSLSGKKAVEWLGALERALRYSLACHLTLCATSLPSQLLLMGNAEEGLLV